MTPVAAPGPALRPLAISLPSFLNWSFSFWLKIGARSWTRSSALRRCRAVFSSIIFSLTMSMAMRMPARAVRLPLRVWSM